MAAVDSHHGDVSRARAVICFDIQRVLGWAGGARAPRRGGGSATQNPAKNLGSPMQGEGTGCDATGVPQGWGPTGATVVARADACPWGPAAVRERRVKPFGVTPAAVPPASPRHRELPPQPYNYR